MKGWRDKGMRVEGWRVGGWRVKDELKKKKKYVILWPVWILSNHFLHRLCFDHFSLEDWEKNHQLTNKLFYNWIVLSLQNEDVVLIKCQEQMCRLNSGCLCPRMCRNLVHTLCFYLDRESSVPDRETWEWLTAVSCCLCSYKNIHRFHLWLNTRAHFQLLALFMTNHFICQLFPNCSENKWEMWPSKCVFAESVLLFLNYECDLDKKFHCLQPCWCFWSVICDR